MPPNNTTEVSQAPTANARISRPEKLSKVPAEVSYNIKNLVWKYVILMGAMNGFGLCGLFLLISGRVKLATFLWHLVIGYSSGFSVTIGIHRHWTHRSFSATWQLKALSAFFFTMNWQLSMYDWIKMHRQHHKYMDTNADRHSIKRGFFYAHIGWLLLPKHPDCVKVEPTISMRDIEADSIIMWQHRYNTILTAIFTIIMPTLVPIYFWGEDPIVSWLANFARWAIVLNVTCLINSAAHTWGTKPYDKTITPGNNKIMGFIIVGEAWHNYHHVFPWDYKISEYGMDGMNYTAAIIEFFAKIGWAYNLRTVPPELAMKRAKRTGDGSLFSFDDSHNDENAVWGWDDPNVPEEDKKHAVTMAQKKEDDGHNDENKVRGWVDPNVPEEDKKTAVTKSLNKESWEEKHVSLRRI